MRIAEEILRSGFFWLPNAPDKKLPGTLKISDGGKIELEILDDFDTPNNNKLLRILGNIDREGLVTLDNCTYRTETRSGAIIKSSIRVETALFGVHYDAEEELLFNQFRFSAEGLDEWLNITGISLYNNLTEVDYRIDFISPEKRSFRLENGCLISFGFNHRRTLFRSLLNEARILQYAYVEFAADQPIPVDDFISLASKFVEFLSFSIDAVTSICKVTVSSNNVLMHISENETHPFPIKLYYQSRPFLETSPRALQPSMLFTFPEIQQNAESIINNWISAYESVGPALNLYFLSKSGGHKYLEGKFLSLAQGLETYHRRTSTDTLMKQEDYKCLVGLLIDSCPDEHKKWLEKKLVYGNEISLRKRLKSSLDPFKKIFGSKSEVKKIINNVVRTRNYLTHYDKKLEKKAARGLELWKMCIKMEVLLQLNLLKKIGFTDDEVIFIAKNSIVITRKLSET